MGELFALLSLAIYSVNVIITKVASGRLDLNVGFVIQIAANVLFAGLLYLIQVLAGAPASQFHWYAFFMFVVSGFLTTYLGRSLYFDSIAKLGPSKASAYMVSNPLFTFLISWLFLGESLSAVEIAAMFVVLAGLFLVSYVPANAVKPLDSPEIGPAAGRKRRIFHTGALLALIGAIAYALGSITRGAAVQQWNEPILGGLIGAFTGLLLQLLLNKKARSVISVFRRSDLKAAGLYALSGVFTISAQIGQLVAMRYSPISIVTLITMSQSLLVIPMSYIFLKNQEDINRRVVIGSLLVLAGIAAIILT